MRMRLASLSQTYKREYMTEELRKKLAAEQGGAFWSDLRAHSDRQGLFLVEPNTSLLDVAYAIACDDKATVAGWIGDQTLRRPTMAEIKQWSARLETPFEILIVQPFALAQLKQETETEAECLAE